MEVSPPRVILEWRGENYYFRLFSRFSKQIFRASQFHRHSEPRGAEFEAVTQPVAARPGFQSRYGLRGGIRRLRSG
jgi:hypothetical protein